MQKKINPNTSRSAPATIIQSGYSIAESMLIRAPYFFVSATIRRRGGGWACAIEARSERAGNSALRQPKERAQAVLGPPTGAGAAPHHSINLPVRDCSARALWYELP